MIVQTGEEMQARKGRPKNNVVSVRIDDEDRKVLETISRASCKTVSEIIREVMQDALHQH